MISLVVQKRNLMLLFRPILPIGTMGRVKQTISKEKIFKPKHILKTKANQLQPKQKVRKNVIAKFKQIFSEKRRHYHN